MRAFFFFGILNLVKTSSDKFSSILFSRSGSKFLTNLDIALLLNPLFINFSVVE